jgi:hypothetical protein
MITIYCPVLDTAEFVITPGIVPALTDAPDEKFVIGDTTLYNDELDGAMKIGENSEY